MKYQNDIKKTWKVIKEVIGKIKALSSNLPRRVTIDNVEITDKTAIAENFNDFFATIGSNLAKQIPDTTTNFETYMKKASNIMPEYELTDQEFANAFLTLKSNKSPGYDGISSNVVKTFFDSIA